MVHKFAAKDNKIYLIDDAPEVIKFGGKRSILSWPMGWPKLLISMQVAPDHTPFQPHFGHRIRCVRWRERA